MSDNHPNTPSIKPPLPSRNQIVFWVGLCAVLYLIMYVFGAVLLPFILGAVIAYLLDPIVEKIGKSGFSRIVSTLFILGGFFAFISILLALIIPALSAELLRFFKELPSYLQQGWQLSEPYRIWLAHKMGMDELVHARGLSDLGQIEGIKNGLKEGVKGSGDQIISLSQNILSSVISGGQSLINGLSILLITPIVAFYMMIEWPKITQWGRRHIPRHNQEVITRILADMDTKIAGFIRGQLLVAGSLAIIYALAMRLAGLEFGLTIGLLAGFLSIIPLVGSTVGLLAGISVAYFQSFDLSYVALIAGIFVAGQVLEGYVLTPKLVGDRVGLHSLWILFSLMAGGALFGFVGVLIAVPVAACASVLISFALEQYRQSRYYNMQDPQEK